MQYLYNKIRNFGGDLLEGGLWRGSSAFAGGKFEGLQKQIVNFLRGPSGEGRQLGGGGRQQKRGNKQFIDIHILSGGSLAGDREGRGYSAAASAQNGEQPKANEQY